MRPGVTSMMRARPWTESVMTPAWLPVKERASCPRSAIAMASTAIEIRSPAVRSMSSSRGWGCGVTCWARSISSSVLSPMAETTTTTSWPAFFVSTMRRATRFTQVASATDEPPYFWTISDTSARTSCRVLGGLGQVTSLPAAPGRSGTSGSWDIRLTVRTAAGAATSRARRRGTRGTPDRTGAPASAPRRRGRTSRSPAGRRRRRPGEPAGQQQRLTEDDRGDREVHRVPDVAVGAAHDEVLGRRDGCAASRHLQSRIARTPGAAPPHRPGTGPRRATEPATPGRRPGPATR